MYFEKNLPIKEGSQVDNNTKGFFLKVLNSKYYHFTLPSLFKGFSPLRPFHLV